MANTQEYTTVIKLNDTEAKNHLEALRKKVEELAAAKDKALKAGSDSKFLSQLSKDLTKAKAELKAYDNNVRKTVDTLNNLSSATMGDLKRAARAIKREMDNVTDQQQYNELNNHLHNINERMQQIKGSTAETDAELRKVAADAKLAADVLDNIGTASINDLKAAQTTLETNIANLNPASEEYARQNENLQKVRARLTEIAEKQKVVNTIVDQYNNEMAEAGLEVKKVATNTVLVERTMKNLSTASVTDLKYSLKIVNDELKHLDRGTAEFKQMQLQAKQLNTELKKVRMEGDAQEGWMSRLADWANKWQAAVVSLIATLTGLTLTVRKSVSDYAEMEDVMASTSKYTGLADDQVRELNDRFKEMDTRTAREQLNDYAGAAGRLGLQSQEAIMDFVDGADKIAVALGDDLGEGAVDTIGKLAMAFGEDKKKGLRGAMLATGSALNELAQNSSANAGYIVDFTSRLAGMGLQADISQQNIMGFASVLDQNMQQVETSATALGQLITKIYQDPAKFAKLAGQDVKQFTELLQTDANQALLDFFASMNSRGGFKELAPMFSEMGLDGNRAVAVLSTMASKLDDVKTAQKLANSAYAEGTSVIKEYDTMNNTVNAQLDKAKKAFSELTIQLGEQLLPVARYGFKASSMFISVLSTLINLASRYRAVTITLTVAVSLYTAAVLKSVVADKLKVFWNNMVVTSFKKVWAVMRANPYAAVITAVALLAAAMVDLTRKTKEHIVARNRMAEIEQQGARNAVEETTKLKILYDATQDQNRSQKERLSYVQKLKSEYPDYFQKLSNEAILAGKAASKYAELTQNIIAAAKARAYEDEITKLTKQNISEQDKVDRDNSYLSNRRQKYNKEVSRKKETVKTTTGATSLVAGFTEAQIASNSAQVYTSPVIQNYEQVQKNRDVRVKNIASREATIKKYAQRAADLMKKGDAILAGNISNNGGSSQSASKGANEKDLTKEREDAIKQETDKELILNTIKYRKGEQDYSEYIANLNEITRSGLEARKKVYVDAKATERQEYYAILKEQSDYEQNLRDDQLAKSLDDIETEKVRKTAAAQAAFYDQTSLIYNNEEMLNERLYQIDIDALRAKLTKLKEMNKAGTEDFRNIESEIAEREGQHRLQQAEQWQQKYQQMLQEYRKLTAEEQEAQELASLDALNLTKLGREEEYQRMLLAIKAKYARMNMQDSTPGADSNDAVAIARARAGATDRRSQSNYVGSGIVDAASEVMMYANTQAKLEELRQEGLISEAQYIDARKQLHKDFYDKLPLWAQVAMNDVNQFMQGMTSFYTAQSNYEQQVTTRKYDRMIEAAGSNSAKAKKLEEKKQKELAAIKTKYNRKAMKIEIAQALASTAVAAINAYKTAPAPVMVFGPIAAAMATAAGLLQVATIKKQHAAEEAGYYSGGFTGGTNYRKRAGVVHEGEFVANHLAVENPNVLPALQLIDMAQRNNTIGTLRAEDLSQAVGQGAPTVVSAPTVNVHTDNAELRQTLDAAVDVISRLQTVLASGIHASVSMDGEDGIAHQTKVYNRLKNNV